MQCTKSIFIIADIATLGILFKFWRLSQMGWHQQNDSMCAAASPVLKVGMVLHSYLSYSGYHSAILSNYSKSNYLMLNYKKRNYMKINEA